MEAGGLGGRWSSTVLKVRFFWDTLYIFAECISFDHPDHLEYLYHLEHLDHPDHLNHPNLPVCIWYSQVESPVQPCTAQFCPALTSTAQQSTLKPSRIQLAQLSVQKPHSLLV